LADDTLVTLPVAPELGAAAVPADALGRVRHRLPRRGRRWVNERTDVTVVGTAPPTSSPNAARPRDIRKTDTDVVADLLGRLTEDLQQLLRRQPEEVHALPA